MIAYMFYKYQIQTTLDKKIKYLIILTKQIGWLSGNIS